MIKRDFRLGMIARSDNRGLGSQLWEFARHMRPEKILVMDMGQYSPYEARLERFPDARVTHYTAVTQEDIEYLLEGIDVLYTAETPYEYRILEQADQWGVATVIQANHEFFRWLKEPDLARPDLFIAPSTWHYEDWPQPKTFLPFPVARDRLPRRAIKQARTFLHVAGHRAMRDRNGTNTVARALRYLRSPVRMLIRAQSKIPSFQGRAPRHIEIDVSIQDLVDYWELYAEGDVLIAPRRFGGLSLPINEAMSVGMPVIAFDVEPQRRFLPREGLVRPATRYHIESQAGPISWWDCRPRDLAQRIEIFANDPDMVMRLSGESDRLAESISWDSWGTEAYTKVLQTLVRDGSGAASERRLWCPWWEVDCLCLEGGPCVAEELNAPALER